MRQQLSNIHDGQYGPEAAKAVKAIARHNGVASLATSHRYSVTNMMGVFNVDAVSTSVQSIPNTWENDGGALFDMTETRSDVRERQYQEVFEHASVAMGISSLGGTFLECNRLFCEKCQFSKHQICSLSIFHLTAKDQLSHAFDQLNSLLTEDPSSADPIILRGILPRQQLHIQLLNRSRAGLDEKSTEEQKGDCRSKLLLVTLLQEPATLENVDLWQTISSTAGEKVSLASTESPQESLPIDGRQQSSPLFYRSIA